jgi:two-component system LytT family response regulator
VNKLRALIVDDELHARENLRMMLQEFCPDVEVLDQAGGVNEAIEKIKRLKPGLLFLDIRMPSGSEGFDLLSQLNDSELQVVFVTAFKDYAIRAFQANAVHYLLKPVDPDDLIAAVAKVVTAQGYFNADKSLREDYHQRLMGLREEAKNAWPNRISVATGKGFKVIQVKDIIRIEASGNHCYIFLSEGRRMIDSRPLGTYEEMLDPRHFMRVHKSHLINLSAVAEYRSDEGHTAILTDKSEVPIARARTQEFIERFRHP